MSSQTFLPDALQSITTLSYICIALVIIVAVLAVLCVVNIVSLRRLGRRYESFMYSKNSRGVSVEALLDECLAETHKVARDFSVFKIRLGSLETQINGCFQKIGVVRYNPFNDTGGDLSYVIALLDDTNSGFVLNGIYNRSGSYTYAKEIANGVPVKHKLSAEEHEALQIAVSGESRNYQ